MNKYKNCRNCANLTFGSGDDYIWGCECKVEDAPVYLVNFDRITKFEAKGKNCNVKCSSYKGVE